MNRLVFYGFISVLIVDDNFYYLFTDSLIGCFSLEHYPLNDWAGDNYMKFRFIYQRLNNSRRLNYCLPHLLGIFKYKLIWIRIFQLVVAEKCYRFTI